jgi:adenylate cyclase class 2
VLEIEVKVRVADIRLMHTKLLELGAGLLKERHRETNTLYDFRSRSLLAKCQALRVRSVGKKAYMTFKGTPQKSRKFKVREEFETEVKNAQHLKKILKSLGFAPVFSYEKLRTVYKKGNLRICLDETAAGNFLELEGEREKIARFLGLLKIPKKDWIKLDYIQLLQKAGKKGRVP